MPGADTGIGLPGEWFYFVALAALYISCHTFLLLLIQHFTKYYGLQAAVVFNAGIIQVRGNPQPASFTGQSGSAISSSKYTRSGS